MADIMENIYAPKDDLALKKFLSLEEGNNSKPFKDYTPTMEFVRDAMLTSMRNFGISADIKKDKDCRD